MAESTRRGAGLTPSHREGIGEVGAKNGRSWFFSQTRHFQGNGKGSCGKNAEQMGDPKLAKLGKTWLQRFLNRHPNVSSKVGSNLDRQRALAGNTGPIIDYSRKLKKALKQYNFLPENIYNMDEKGFILGMSSRAKVISRAGRRPPRVMQDGTRELITVIETICASTAAQFILPTMVIYKGAAHYRGLYTELGEEGGADAIFAYSPKDTTRMQSLQSFQDISEVHRYPPPHLNPTSF